MKLSETARALSCKAQGAAQREDRLVPRRPAVPTVADVDLSPGVLVKQGLVEIIRAPADVSDVVIVREGDCGMAFLIADAGFRAINLNPPSSEADAAGTLKSRHGGASLRPRRQCQRGQRCAPGRSGCAGGVEGRG